MKLHLTGDGGQRKSFYWFLSVMLRKVCLTALSTISVMGVPEKRQELVGQMDYVSISGGNKIVNWPGCKGANFKTPKRVLLLLSQGHA